MAAEDAGPGERLLREIDTLAVMGVIGWRYEDAPGLLSRQLGIDPRRRLYSSIGGNTPQWLVNRSCREIERGDVGAVLITGAEALATQAIKPTNGISVVFIKGTERRGENRWPTQAAIMF